MVEEILQAGFSRIELGYDLRRDMLDGVREQVRTGAVRVVSVHNYCPVPMGVPRGHPEIWTFAHSDPEVRRKAVEHTARSVRLAAELGARAVVVHAGYVGMRPLSPRLIRLTEKGRRDSWWGRRTSATLDTRRERLAPKHLEWISQCLEQITAVLDETGVPLAFENLPSWESAPSERELPGLIARFGESRLRYWHDLGHGTIRENLGWISHERLLDRLAPWLAGMHIHDVRFPAKDHVLPGEGDLDFTRFSAHARKDLPLVIEAGQDAAPDALRKAADFLKTVWTAPTPSRTPGRFGSIYDPMPVRDSKARPADEES